jgi:3-oxoadipate enol-lactonase
VPELTRPDECRIHYELHGADDAGSLILLEGMGGDIPGWRRNIPTLAHELRVIAYDFRGNGGSDEPPGPCTMATFVDDTIALLDEVDVDRADVYGQSFGGMVAQELALAWPERVRTLILGCTHCGGTNVVPSRNAKTPKDKPWLALYSEAFAAAKPEHVAEDLRVGAEQPRHPTGQRRQWEAMQGFDTYDRLPWLRVPTLVLHGTEDRLVAPANAEVLAARIPDAELVLLDGAGHVYHSEQPEATDEAVLDFIRRRTS